MASGGHKSMFVTPGTCSMDGCEVTLLLDGQTRLYACKHALMDKCGFFKGLFSTDFREKNSNEVEIKEVPHSDMLLFLECQFGHFALPLDGASLCALISLADQFMCPSLQERINDHLDTESMFLNLSPDTKLDLIRAADEHKASCLPLLETCIRLCANLSFKDVSVLNAQISGGAMLAVYNIVADVAKYMDWLPTHQPTHQCVPVVYGYRPVGGIGRGHARDERVVDEMRQYDQSAIVEVNDKQVEVWECSVCKGRRIKETFTYAKVKEFEIDQATT